MALRAQLWDVGNDTLRNEDVSGLWKLTVITSVVSKVSVALWFFVSGVGSYVSEVWHLDGVLVTHSGSRANFTLALAVGRARTHPPNTTPALCSPNR